MTRWSRSQSTREWAVGSGRRVSRAPGCYAAILLLLIVLCSWENGTKAQAILEWTYPDLSVFATSSSSNPFPASLSTNQIPQIMSIAEVTMQNRPPTNTSGINGGSALLEDGAAADPASLGPAILLASAATNNAQVAGVGYGDAAGMEANWLLYNVPRVSAWIGPVGGIRRGSSVLQQLEASYGSALGLGYDEGRWRGYHTENTGDCPQGRHTVRRHGAAHMCIALD